MKRSRQHVKATAVKEGVLAAKERNSGEYDAQTLIAVRAFQAAAISGSSDGEKGNPNITDPAQQFGN